MLNRRRVVGVSNRCLALKTRRQLFTKDLRSITHYESLVPCAITVSRSLNSNASVHDSFPKEARVVIGGGGILGCSVAYHLAKAGWKDIVVLEQGKLGCGSTWQSSGVVGCLRTTPSVMAIVSESMKLYKDLHSKGYDIGFRQTGSLNLCRKQDRVISYKRSLLVGQRFGVEGEFLSPTEIKTRVPFLRTEDLLGGMWVPGDCIVDSMKLNAALAKEARNSEVKIIEKCKIEQVLSNADLVYGVETSLGRINCDVFVNCAGMWAHDLGKRTNTPIRVPLHPCEQSVVHTKPIAGISADMPVIRDYDGYTYMREYNGALLGSGFPLIAKPAFKQGIPKNFEFQFLPEDWDYFKPLLDQLLHRVPSLVNIEPQQLATCVEASTPDGKYIIGGVPEIQNYYVAAGMNASGTAAAGGIGKYLTEWIINGESSVNLWSFDIQRFVDIHNNSKFLRERVAETFGTVSQVPYWEAEMIGYDSGRRLRTSAIFTRNEPYAVFGQTMAYERPLYFHSASMVDDDAENTWTMPKPASIHGIKAYALHGTGLPKKGTYGKPDWLDNVRSEYWACREGVCIIDMSTFAKFELRSAGKEVVNFLQYVCSNDIDRAVGSVVHTGMQNHNGGFENDCSVIRLDHNRFFMVGPTAQQTRCFSWLRDHLPKDGSVLLSDVTSMYTALDVIGPKAQELLSELTDTPLGKQDFMHMTCKNINIAMVSGIRAMRLTHTGEDGFMLYVPSEVALHVYDSLITYGKNYGLRSAGYYALRALRTEKFFAYWGTDLTPQDTPLECGRDFRVKYDLGGFIGYSALLRQRAEGIRKRLVQFVIEDHSIDEDPWPWSGEPIYRNGLFCGFTTSTAFGFGLDRHICLGYVQDFDPATGQANLIKPNEFILDKGARFEINIAGKMFPARALLYPPILPSPSSFQQQR